MRLGTRVVQTMRTSRHSYQLSVAYNCLDVQPFADSGFEWSIRNKSSHCPEHGLRIQTHACQLIQTYVAISLSPYRLIPPYTRTPPCIVPHYYFDPPAARSSIIKISFKIHRFFTFNFTSNFHQFPIKIGRPICQNLLSILIGKLLLNLLQNWSREVTCSTTQRAMTDMSGVGYMYEYHKECLRKCFLQIRTRPMHGESKNCK
jgi:hypothetical protein